jgi:hypothetical protein
LVRVQPGELESACKKAIIVPAALGLARNFAKLLPLRHGAGREPSRFRPWLLPAKATKPMPSTPSKCATRRRRGIVTYGKCCGLPSCGRYGAGQSRTASFSAGTWPWTRRACSSRLVSHAPPSLLSMTAACCLTAARGFRLPTPGRWFRCVLATAFVPSASISSRSRTPCASGPAMNSAWCTRM